MIFDLVSDFYVYNGENYDEEDKDHIKAACICGAVFTSFAILGVFLKRWGDNVNEQLFYFLFWGGSYLRVLLETVPMSFLIVYTAYKGIKLD